MQLPAPLLPPPPLPDPPLLEHHLLESPWAATLLLLIGAGVSWALSQRQQRPRPARFASMAFLLLAAGVFALASLVTTDRERVTRLTRDLVAAVAKADLPAVRATLAEDAMLYFFEQPGGLTLQGILDRLERDFVQGGMYQITDHSVLEVQATLDEPTRARVQTRVRVTAAATGTPYTSWWRLDFVRTGEDRWQVSGIQPLVLPGIRNPGGR